MIRTPRHALWTMLAAVAILAGAAGCAGTEQDSATPTRTLVDPAVFEAAIAEPETVTINVHTPDEGSIAGTDLAIPFDSLERRKSELPAVSTPLAVYCRSGRMSAEAVKTLKALGYQDVVELRGGMIAWADSGRQILASQG